MNNNSFVCGLLVQLLKLDNEYERLDKLPSGTLCSISIELSIEQTIRWRQLRYCDNKYSNLA